MFEQRGSRYEAEVPSRCEGSTLYRLPESESCGLVPVCFLYILCGRLWDGINNRVKEIDDENVWISPAQPFNILHVRATPQYIAMFDAAATLTT